MMIPNIEIGKIYKLSDANPPAFAKIIKISKHDVWNDVLEEDELTQLAWGDMFRWADNPENKPIETLIRMLDGYEVEEEPKWVVKKREDSYFKSFTGIDFRSSS
ncbi:DUF1642 domain-containing protein, partial [Enterococcus devriesei]|uniref:DUF1642 domain-containing protein n=2 Tax=Enterococcus devriesei TaxID=319970 RepID=UPI0035ECA50C